MITISVTAKGNALQLQRIREGLANRAPLHARIAANTEEFTKTYVRALHSRQEEHRTATRLGATPTGEFIRAAKGISSVSDASGATLRFPRASRLRAAFGEYTVRPKNGPKWLTIAAHATTYGHRARVFTNLKFQFRGQRHAALVFDDGPYKGKVAYWLVKETTIKEDRGLVPFDELPIVAMRVAQAYVKSLKDGKGQLT